MGLYKEAKGLKKKVEGLGSAYSNEKKKLMSEYSSAKGKLKAANDQAGAMFDAAKGFKDDVKKGGFKKAAGDRVKKAAKDKWAALSKSASS
jgi:hypothetical protein